MMRPAAARAAGAGLLVLALAACRHEEVGYIEIRTVPVSAAPSLYLDSTKLAPLKNGVAVLRQQVGTAKLQIEVIGGQRALLCDISVKRNRITNVTVSVLERPPRCQCRNPGGEMPPGRTCFS
jgi:hypothetical protein